MFKASKTNPTKGILMKSLLMIILLTTLNTYAQEQAEPLELINTGTTKEGSSLLIDTKGNTLYVFDADLNTPGSVCNASCAELWPPYLITNTEARALTAPLGSIARDNKKVQLTHNGRPVYAYALDRGVADTTGDGIGNVWHIIEVKDEVK